MAFIAGPYIATWGGNYIGKTLEGFNQTETIHSQDIKTDDFGGMNGALVDAVILGKSTIVELDYAEYDAIAKATLVNQGADALLAAAGGYVNAAKANMQVGVMASTLAKPLVLTKIPVVGRVTTATPASRTFSLALVMGSIPIMLSAGLRHGPIRFICFPNSTITATYSTGAGTVTPDANYGSVYSDT